MFPVGNQKVAFLGELAKWTPVSSQRFRKISYGSKTIDLEINVSQDEEVILVFAIFKPPMYTFKTVEKSVMRNGKFFKEVNFQAVGEFFS